MRLKNVPGSREAISESEFAVDSPEELKGKWKKDRFNNENPLYIEVGMGKGRFITELARLNPDINYIGIEKYSSVLIRAVQKMEEEPLPNLCFIRMDAEDIEAVFEKGEVDRIYLNFSDPWPKDRHAKRRLTSREYLKKYDTFLKKEGRVEFKTDNTGLFEFSLAEADEAGWEKELVTFDLHNSEFVQGNVMTEYEERFSKEGNPIHKMVIHR